MRRLFFELYYKQIFSFTPITSFSLFLLYIVVTPLMLGFEKDFLCHFHLGLIWISLLFSFLSAPFFRNEKEDGTLELYYLSAYCLPKILLLQLVGHWVIQISCVFCGFPMLQLLYQFGRSGMDWLNILLGSLVLTLLCGIHSCLALGITSGSGWNSLQNLTTLPTLLPLTVFCTSIETEWFHVPLLIGYFSLSVPSGLSLYWFTNNILSTAQQVWLQQLGGAKNLVGTFTEDIIKEEKIQNQKSISELRVLATKTEERQEEKLTSEGPRPGERFKQLKEQEAKRRQQIEEERKKAEEAAAKATQIAIEGHEREAKLLERENGAAADSVVENNEKFQSVTTFHDSSNVEVAVNGDSSGQDSEEDQNMTSTFTMENEVSGNSKVDGSDGQQSYENVEKETVELYSTTTTKDNKISGEDMHQARRE